MDLDAESWKSRGHHLPLLYDNQGNDLLPESRRDGVREVIVGGDKEIVLACPKARVRNTTRQAVTAVCISGRDNNIYTNTMGNLGNLVPQIWT